VSKDAKIFIGELLQPNPDDRPSSREALSNRWLKGETASDHDILPEIKSYITKARLRRGIEMVKLANRIEALKMHEDEPTGDVPSDTGAAAAEGTAPGTGSTPGAASRRLSKAARSAIFREVVLAKVREVKAEAAKENAQRTLTDLTMGSSK